MTDLVTGDTGSVIRVTCSDSAGVINLTGAAVRIRWEGVDGLLVNRTMTIDNAISGIVSYRFVANEIFHPKIVFEVEITDATGYIITSKDMLTLIVREQIG